MVYDLIIVGLGPAGAGAAIYAKRSGLNVLCLEAEAPGGLLNRINTVDNYLGFPHTTGPELAALLFEQIRKLEIPFKIKKVTWIEGGETKKVHCDNEVFESKYVIIASGRKARKLGLKNEANLVNKGISYCAICDAALYKGKDVAVVGGGNSAIEEAIYIAKLVNKVYLIHRRDEFRADEKLVEELKKLPNVEILYNSNVTELIGTEKLEGIIVNGERKLDVACLFTYVGYEPQGDFLSDLEITDEKGYILVDDNYQTKEDGIYAVGDAILKKVYQIVTAASEGAVAALEVVKRVKNNN